MQICWNHDIGPIKDASATHGACSGDVSTSLIDRPRGIINKTLGVGHYF
jgi:hypothetical protein